MILEQEKIEALKTAIDNAVDRGYNKGYTDGATSNDEEVYENGYNSGFADGKKEILDNSKYIEKTAEGTGVVALDDVSEVPHDITVQLTGEDVAGKTVTVFGANILDGSDRITPNTIDGLTIQYLAEEDCYIINGTSERDRNFYIIDKTILVNNSVSVRTIVVGGTITNPENKTAVFFIGGSDTLQQTKANWVNCSIVSTSIVTSTTSKKYLRSTWFYIEKGITFSNYKVKIQVGIGNGVYDYMPYESKSCTTDANGIVKGIKSISPNMTFMCDGVDMTVSYHKSYGMQTERDRFWGGLQQNGKRTSFINAFYGSGWYDYIFTPIYPFKVANGNQMFMSSGITDTKVDIDLTPASKPNDTKNVFYANKMIKNVRKYIVNENTTYEGHFNGCSALEHIKFEGVIGQDLNFSACPLDRESIDNVLDHLKQFYMTWTETTNTSWRVGTNGAWAIDGLIVKIDDVEGWKEYGGAHNYSSYVIATESYEDHGVTNTFYFYDKGEVDLSTFFSKGITFDIDHVEIAGGFSYTVYEGIVHEAPATPPSATFKRSAVDAAYTAEEWNAKVLEAQKKGWTIQTV